MTRKILSIVSLLTIAALVLTACGGGTTPVPPTQPAKPAEPTKPAAPPAAKGKLEMFSWWTAGGEADGLNAMYDLYKKAYPTVEIVNATVAGGAGTNAKAVLATRLTGGDPPDSFQLHAGLEVEKYEPAKYLQPLDSLYTSQGWDKAFPKDLISLLKYRITFGACRSTSTVLM